MAVSFEIPGDPVAKARPRAAVVAGRARLYTPAKTRELEIPIPEVVAEIERLKHEKKQ